MQASFLAILQASDDWARAVHRGRDATDAQQPGPSAEGLPSGGAEALAAINQSVQIEQGVGDRENRGFETLCVFSCASRCLQVLGGMLPEMYVKV